MSAPHPEFITSRYYTGRLDESEITIPPEDKTKHPVLVYQRINKNWTHGFSSETVKLVRSVYFAMISEVDEMVGEIISAIEKFNLRDSTYIIFSSDHGELAMEHQQYYKMSPYEGSVRIPLIISGPDVRKGIEAGIPVSLLDIYPTMKDLASLKEVPYNLDGFSLVSELTGSSSKHPEWIFHSFMIRPVILVFLC